MPEDSSNSWLKNLLIRLGLASQEMEQRPEPEVPISTETNDSSPPGETEAYQDVVNSLRFAEQNMQDASLHDAETSSILGDGIPDVALSRSADTRDMMSPRMAVNTSRDIPPSRPGQLLNLSPTQQARFQVTDRVWPEQFGEASICQWKGDRLAAFSLTIDDNHVQDHPFWMEVSNEFGFKLTWFLIANKVGWVHEQWSHWQPLLNAGHDIQSHGFSHLCDAMFYLQREYRQAIDDINNNLTGAQVLTHGYAFGLRTNKVGSPCECIKTKNERNEAAKYFLAARDVVGAISPIARLDFLAVPSVSNMRNFFNSNTPWAHFDTVFDPNNRNSYRSWYCGHMHHVPDDATKQHVRKVFEHLSDKRDDVWVGTFTQVAKYAQQYATARIVGLKVQARQIRFEVKDDMYDGWFDEPLTVKIRLNQDWGMNLRATQNGQTIHEVEVFLQGGQPYVLVDVIPDRGIVTLTP